MKIKKGDTIVVISGKDRGRTGKVLRSLPAISRIVVEGMNMKNKHVKPKRREEKGQMVKIAAPMDVSNAKFLCPRCGKASRIGYTIEKGRKYRICKKCKSEV